MSWFRLDPESIRERAVAAGGTIHVPTVAGSIFRGVVGFTIVSVAGFAPWAFFGRWFYRNIGEAGLYAVCALVFIGLSGPLLHRLIIGPGSLVRFYKLFAVSFTAYSICWIAGYILLRGHVGGIAGLLAGAIAMGLILVRAFDAGRQAWKVIAAIFILNTLGYFIGGWVEAELIRSHRLLAMLLWGVCYGIGFGAGLGVAFHLCQTRARALLATAR